MQKHKLKMMLLEIRGLGVWGAASTVSARREWKSRDVLVMTGRHRQMGTDL